MTYDHHKKAGNQGDVVKHVALIAALDTIISMPSNSCRKIHYADMFAGYAYSPLIQGNEWDQGIDKVFRKGNKLSENRHTKLWYEWYLQGRPKLLGGVYPGSSLIANDVCCLHNVKPSLSLWDISQEVIANLTHTYSKSGHRIFCSPAVAESKVVKSSDFLFIDPPGLRSPKNKSYPTWTDMRRFLECRNEEKPALMWLPVKAVTTKTINGSKVNLSPPEEDNASKTARQQAKAIGCRTLRVRWTTGGHTIGCVLICIANADVWRNIELAVKHIVDVADWQSQLHEKLKALE